MNNLSAYIDVLSYANFVMADHEKDFGGVLPGICYVEKQRGNYWEYVQVITYDGTFCEAVYELYAAQKNTRCKADNTLDAMKRGGQSVTATIVRDLDTLSALISRNESQLQETINSTFTELQRKTKK